MIQCLNDSKNLIIDTRSFKDYSDGHIPGAVNLGSFWHFIGLIPQKKELKISTNKLKCYCSPLLGITEEKKIIFYDEVSGMLAARGVWMLMYFSHPNVVMLDGGMNKMAYRKSSIR